MCSNWFYGPIKENYHQFGEQHLLQRAPKIPTVMQHVWEYRVWCVVFLFVTKTRNFAQVICYHQLHFHHFLSLRLWDIFTKPSHFWRLGPLNVSGIFHQKRPHSPTLREGGPMDGQGDRTTPDASNLSGFRWFPLICQIETYVSSVLKTRMCWKSFHSRKRFRVTQRRNSSSDHALTWKKHIDIWKNTELSLLEFLIFA